MLANHTTNPYELNQVAWILSPTDTNVNGQIITAWSIAYDGVYLGELAPPRGREVVENNQNISVNQHSFLLRNEKNRTIKSTYLIILNGQTYYLTGTPRKYKRSLDFIVCDTEHRDNQKVYIITPDGDNIATPEGDLIEYI